MSLAAVAVRQMRKKHRQQQQHNTSNLESNSPTKKLKDIHEVKNSAKFKKMQNFKKINICDV